MSRPEKASRLTTPAEREKQTASSLETFRADKAIFSSSISKCGEAYTPEISRIALYERASGHIQDM